MMTENGHPLLPSAWVASLVTGLVFFIIADMGVLPIINEKDLGCHYEDAFGEDS